MQGGAHKWVGPARLIFNYSIQIHRNHHSMSACDDISMLIKSWQSFPSEISTQETIKWILTTVLHSNFLDSIILNNKTRNYTLELKKQTYIETNCKKYNDRCYQTDTSLNQEPVSRAMLGLVHVYPPTIGKILFNMHNTHPVDVHSSSSMWYWTPIFSINRN